MKLIVTSFGDLEDLMLALPFIKGLQDMYPQSDITLASFPKFEKISKIAPYVHNFVSCDTRDELYQNNSFLFEFDQIIDLDKLYQGEVDKDLAVFLKSDIKAMTTGSCPHKAEILLRYIPKQIRRLSFHLQESLAGYERAKAVLSQECDLVIYPFEKNKNIKSITYNLNLFLKYFMNMNPGKKVLLIGFRHQQESLAKIIEEMNAGEAVLSAAVDLESCLSLLKKAKHFIVGNSPLKHLASQSQAVVYDIHSSMESIQETGIYKDQSYCLFLNEKPLQKIVYRADEFVFENNAHFLAYFVTSVIDNDYEKMLLLTEGYQVHSKVYKTSLNRPYGWRSVPLFWNKDSFKEFIAYNALRFSSFDDHPEIFENVYDHIMEDSDYSYDRIFYETSSYLNQIVTTRDILSKDSTFGIFIKLQELESHIEYRKILQVMAQYLDFDIHSDTSALKIEDLQRKLPKVRTGLKDIQKFLNEFKIYASQKILESFDSTGDLRI